VQGSDAVKANPVLCNIVTCILQATGCVVDNRGIFDSMKRRHKHASVTMEALLGYVFSLCL
jgi:hypothetical protein